MDARSQSSEQQRGLERDEYPQWIVINFNIIALLNFGESRIGVDFNKAKRLMYQRVQGSMLVSR